MADSRKALPKAHPDPALAGQALPVATSSQSEVRDQVSPPPGEPEGAGAASFQSIFCIDEREDSIRRHIEAVDRKCVTYGAPGFFGVEFYFQQQGSKFYDKLCPAPVTPKYLIAEPLLLFCYLKYRKVLLHL